MTDNWFQKLFIDDVKAILPPNNGGGGGTVAGGSATDDVVFYDYDGTILHSYSFEETQELTELPELPEHKGLICQGWNWTLDEIKQLNRKVDVGAMYITDDGHTRIYISLQEGRSSPMLGVCPNGTVTVDWGDGTTPDVLTGTSITSVVWTPTHEYAEAGDYVINLIVDGEMGLYGASATDQFSAILRHSSESDVRNSVYRCSVKKVELGNGITSVGDSTFRYCYSLKSITIPASVTYIGVSAFEDCYSLTSISLPNSVTSIKTYAFDGCQSLTSVSLPNSVTSIGDGTFQYCYSLTSVSLPNSVTSIGNDMFMYCYSLTSITIPDRVTSIRSNVFDHCRILASVSIPNSVTSIGNSTFQYCYSLTSITIPDRVKSINYSDFYYCYSLTSIAIPASVTSIGANAFGSCTGMRYYDFTKHTTVPTLSTTNAFSNIPADCEILVPSALYDEWVAATNWSTYADYIVAR